LNAIRNNNVEIRNRQVGALLIVKLRRVLQHSQQ